MKDILNLIIYIFRNYPKVEELSKPRLVKLIFLTDWKHVIDNGKQATSIKWYFNHYGPYVDTIIDLVKQNDKVFTVQTSINSYGGVSDKIKLISNEDIQLDDSVKNVIDFIMENTANRNWSEFINLVYSTYPVKNNSKYTYLNLVDDAVKFKYYRQQHLQEIGGSVVK